jgi:DNA helicase-2/ATP-dependent DNA helicase PcrA
VLYRSNIQARPLEERCASGAFPSSWSAGRSSTSARRSRTSWPYLKLALNPRDEIALRRIVNYPARGIGAATVERAAQWARRSACRCRRRCGRFEEIPTRPRRPHAVASFSALVQKLRRRWSAASERAASDARARLVEDIELYADLRAGRGQRERGAAPRRQRGRLLRRSTAQQARKPGADALLDYLRFLSLKSSDDDDSAGAARRSC